MMNGAPTLANSRFRIGERAVGDDDAGGLDVSASGFDSDMVAYFAVVQFAGSKYLFYNGNDYGRDGVGLAVEV